MSINKLVNSVSICLLRTWSFGFVTCFQSFFVFKSCTILSKLCYNLQILRKSTSSFLFFLDLLYLLMVFSLVPVTKSLEQIFTIAIGRYWESILCKEFAFTFADLVSILASLSGLIFLWMVILLGETTSHFVNIIEDRSEVD